MLAPPHVDYFDNGLIQAPRTRSRFPNLVHNILNNDFESAEPGLIPIGSACESSLECTFQQSFSRLMAKAVSYVLRDRHVLLIYSVKSKYRFAASEIFNDKKNSIAYRKTIIFFCAAVRKNLFKCARN